MGKLPLTIQQELKSMTRCECVSVRVCILTRNNSQELILLLLNTCNDTYVENNALFYSKWKQWWARSK